MRTVIFALVLTLAGCATPQPPQPPSRFTVENIRQLRPGMTPDQVIQIFGQPTSVRSTTCSRHSQPWQCEVWNYTNGYDRNTLWFSADTRTPRLDQWEVNTR